MPQVKYVGSMEERADLRHAWQQAKRNLRPFTVARAIKSVISNVYFVDSDSLPRVCAILNVALDAGIRPDEMYARV